MTETKVQVERRKHERYPVPTGVIAVLGPHFDRVGQIMDISRGGIGFRYVDSSEGVRDLTELDIVFESGRFYLDKLPCATRSDVIIPDEFSLSLGRTAVGSTRRCGVQLGDLMPRQVSQLEYFIQNHTIGGGI